MTTEPRAANQDSVLAPQVAAVLALVLWAGTAVANKHAIQYMDALTAGILRSTLAGFTALVICVAWKLPFPAEFRHRVLLITSGLTSFAIWPVLLSFGVDLTTVSHTGLIMAVLPVLTVMLASFVSRSIPTRAWWVGTAIALFGTVYLIFERIGVVDLVAAPDSLTGDFIIFTGCLACSVGYVTGAKLSPVIGATATTFWGLACTLVLVVPLLLANIDKTDWPALPASAWLAIFWMAILSSLVGYVLWFYALGKGGISRIGSLQLMLPVFVLAAAVIVLREALTTELVGVSLMILVGTYVAHANAPARN